MSLTKGDKNGSTTELISAGYGSTADVHNRENLFFENRIRREWLSTEEAAQFLSISANALRIMVHREQIRAYKFGRRLRFRAADCLSLFKLKGA